ncbi:MAG: hypothetical protein ACPL3C_07645, partial [Pyrobaculum sp.]
MGVICFEVFVEGGPVHGVAEQVVAVRRMWANFKFVERGGELYMVIGGQPARLLVWFVEGFNDELYAVHPGPWRLELGVVEGYLADAPIPPLPGLTEGGEVVWTRFAAREFEIAGGLWVNLLLTDPPAASMNYESIMLDGLDLEGVLTARFVPGLRLEEVVAKLSLTIDKMVADYRSLLESREVRFRGDCPGFEGERFPMIIDGFLADMRCEMRRRRLAPVNEFPGSGRLVGEEFRIVEPEGDYLRLVGRGGDEHLAWDLVLGTLDTGEWVLMGEDGLYLAVREGDKVVVEEPYRGSVYDVRGPPYAPHIPVVPVKWVRERFKKAVEFAKRVGLFELRHRGDRPYLYVPPVDPAYLLKWPLVLYKWEYRLVATPVFRYSARLREVNCGEVYGGARGAGAG